MHAHIETTRHDHDGTYTRGHIESMTSEENLSPDGVAELQARVLASTIIPVNGFGTLRVFPHGANWDETIPHNGFLHTEVRWCRKDCEARAWDLGNGGSRERHA